jgi:hypothetical protein
VKKVNFPSSLELGLLRETINLVQYLYANKVTSPKDKWNKNESMYDFVHQIYKYFVCTYSLTSIINEIEVR